MLTGLKTQMGIALLQLFGGDNPLNIFHFHRFSGTIQDGYQFCVKCQKAIPVEHKCQWEEIDKTEIIRNRDETCVVGEVRILKCHICGDLKTFKVAYNTI